MAVVCDPLLKNRNLSKLQKYKNLFEQLDKVQPLVALKDEGEFVVVGEHVQGVPVHVHVHVQGVPVNELVCRRVGQPMYVNKQ